MARCYSAGMVKRQPALPQHAMPKLWLIGDARNDARLERLLLRLPRGSGFVFRHYHLPLHERRRRFAELARLARRRGHLVVLSGSAAEARRWGADGAYGAPRSLARGPACLRLVTAHSLGEIARAKAARADAIALSPVFPTRSHPGAHALGPLRFRLLAMRSDKPVVALGGMTSRRANRLKWRKWAAIDGICDRSTRWIPLDS